MENAISWPAIVSALAAAFQAVVVVVALFFAKKQVDHARELRDSAERPYVIVDFDVLRERPMIYLTISNMGNTLARKVRFKFTPELSSAFDDQHDTIKGLRLLQEGIPSMPPGRTIPLLFDSFHGRGDEHADAYTVQISYEGPGGTRHEDKIILDLGIYRNIQYIDRKDIHDIHGEIRSIAGTMKKWTSSWGGIKIKTPADEQRQHDEWSRLREERRTAVSDPAEAAVSGLSLLRASEDRDGFEPDRALRLGLSTKRRPLRTTDPEQLATGLLTALAGIGRDETLVLQWLLGPTLPPMVVPSQMPGQHSESWAKSFLLAPIQAPAPADSETRTALRIKQGEPGWRAIGRIAVKAAGVSRQNQLLRQVLSVLRSAQAPGVRITAQRESPSRTQRLTVPWFWPMALNVNELQTLSSWPVGPTNDLPVAYAGSRALKASRTVPSRGRVLGLSNWPGKERQVALSTNDSLRHLHVLGPTGTGKSTLLLNLITQDMAAGRAVVVIEPKGDLVSDVLGRIPPARVADVVLLNPTDEDRPVGINPLRTGGRSPELVADQLLAVFHGLYAAHWGPRTQDILHASLLTLVRTPGMTLVALPLLLTNPAFRRKLVGRLNDPLALGPFWAGFEAWSEAERTAAISPVMNKLRPFILRSNLRWVIGQPEPKFDVHQVFTQRKILLVNLSKGQLGPEAAALLGSLVVAQLWQATQERSRTSPERRHPEMVFIDEFQDYLHLPTDLSDALSQARGLGVGLTLAHQHLHQLEPGMRSAVLANARSRVCFQLGQEDARTMAASGSVLEAEDFQSLGRFEVYASLMAEDAVQPWCSLKTVAPGPVLSDAHIIRSQSRQSYGVPRTETDAALEKLVSGNRRDKVDDLSPRRKAAGGSS